MINLIKRSKFLTKIILYVYHKWVNRHLVKFSYSSCMSHRCVFEGMNLIDDYTSFCGHLGKGSYIGEKGLVNAYVGRFSSIGPKCRYINAIHPYKEPFVTTSPLFFSLSKTRTPNGDIFAQKQMIDEFQYYDKKEQIVNKIGSDVWIGYSVCLIGGVAIGDGAIVLSRAIVTKDVPPYAIVGGVPAQVIGYRYDQETIKFLLNIQWWNNSDEWLSEHWCLLCDMQKFKSHYNNLQ